MTERMVFIHIASAFPRAQDIGLREAERCLRSE